jgi:hypothetical protein
VSHTHNNEQRHGVMTSRLTTDTFVRDYYRCFNERRIADAGAQFAVNAVLDMPPFIRDATGAVAYAQFADAWLRAFPDAELRIERVEQRGETTCEIDLIATGTHEGPLDLGMYGLLRPNGVRLTLRLRELLEVHRGQITYASLSFDINHLVRELTRVDYRRLVASLATVRKFADELATVLGDDERRREVTERLGQALDEARRVVRPQFNR